jgi:hypothetical protein
VGDTTTDGAGACTFERLPDHGAEGAVGEAGVDVVVDPAAGRVEEDE